MGRLAPLLGCVLVVMAGVGIVLPVLPFYVERLALAAGSSRRQVLVHVGLLTAAFPLVQLVVAPLWGRLSDRIGRRPMIVVGILGFAVTQVLFGLASGLGMLYAARVLGGALSAALLPATFAYVADLSGDTHRARGIALVGTAVGLGTIVGPGLGALLLRVDLHLRGRLGHFVLDGFSVPFLAAGALAIVGLLIALLALPRTTPAAPTGLPRPPQPRRRSTGLLATAAAAYLGITVFETTFSFYAQERYRFGPAEVGAAFTVCAVVMVAAQLAGAEAARRIGELRVVGIGFASMGLGLLLLIVVGAGPPVYVAVASLGVGMAFVAPNLTSLASAGDRDDVGATVGRQTSAQSLGQVSGPLLGTLLLGWDPRAGYLLVGGMMAAVGVVLSWRRVSPGGERGRDDDEEGAADLRGAEALAEEQGSDREPEHGREEAERVRRVERSPAQDREPEREGERSPRDPEPGKGGEERRRPDDLREGAARG